MSEISWLAGRPRRRVAKRSPLLAVKVIDAVFDALDAQSLALPDETAWGEVIAGARGQIEEAFLHHHPAKVLVSLCGFGPRTLAEIGDPHRVVNAAYAGLAPVDRRSGRSINNTSRSRTGNRRLRNALFIAAFVAARHDPAARADCDAKSAEAEKHNAAITCLARGRCDTPKQLPVHEAALCRIGRQTPGQRYETSRHAGGHHGAATEVSWTTGRRLTGAGPAPRDAEPADTGRRLKGGVAAQSAVVRASW